jgi:hypothetical protein
MARLRICPAQDRVAKTMAASMMSNSLKKVRVRMSGR